ncbi:hypothetical protein FA15DRAFT_672863 [Coprinopsis marcescibilis]|uniref:Large ribosomal subunit protein mL59 domain-containing protein n=1 Tax=Coprinopsis marcescibilis TaxID=230819 RepID=A0A5C3KLC3_COPMA|nr:hypothetical protein FA15DRAFT_672863 [Coprinopsis marcescibilis]
MTTAISNAAKKDVFKFLSRESRHAAQQIRRNGPLPASTATTAESSSAGQNVEPTKGLRVFNPFIPRFNEKTKRWGDPRYSLRRQAELVKKAKAAGLLHHLPPGPKTPLLDPTNPRVKRFNPNYAQLASQAFEEQATAETRRRQPVIPEVKAPRSWTSYPSANDPKAQRMLWEGAVDLKQKAGADIGIKLYAGKKRMFKGHAWERAKVKREERTAKLMVHMSDRIAKYKAFYKKRRPNPLKPPRAMKKMPKLPF